MNYLPNLIGFSRIFSFFVLCLWLAFPISAQAWDTYVGRSLDAYVRRVEANNLLIVSEFRNDDTPEIKISFYGIGIPTLRQPFGREAHEELVRLLPKGSKVVLSTVKQDEEGIVSALVQRNDRSVNNRLVELGLAWVDRTYCKAFFCRRWYIQEHLAVIDQRGIWSLHMRTPPWQWGEPKETDQEP